MEGRNFHTALMGGFRKKDVIGYLAEEKRLQEEQVEALRRGQAELEQQLDEARTDNGANRLLNEELQKEAEVLRQQLEMTRMDLNTAKEAQLLAESRLTQAEARLAMAEEERLNLEGRLASAARENQTLSAENDQLRQTVTELLARPDAAAQAEALRAELEAQKACNGQLEEQLRQLAARNGETGGSGQLWALCGKMERTIRQMEQMLDGPYRLTCYPEPVERAESRVELPEQDLYAEAPAESAVPGQAPTVKNLLQRIRVKR